MFSLLFFYYYYSIQPLMLFPGCRPSMLCRDSAHERRCDQVLFFWGSFDAEVFPSELLGTWTRRHRCVWASEGLQIQPRAPADAPGPGSGRSQRPRNRHGSRRRAWGASEPRRRLPGPQGQAEPVRRQPNPDGGPDVPGPGRVPPLPGLPDGLPGPERQLGSALHADGDLVEEEPPVEGRPDRQRHPPGGQRDWASPQGAAERPADGVLGRLDLARHGTARHCFASSNQLICMTGQRNQCWSCSEPGLSTAFISHRNMTETFPSFFLFGNK